MVVTSRRGDPELWSGVTDEQVLRLGPLSQEEAMAVLWRRGKGKPRNFTDDAQVLYEMEKLKDENWDEYGALGELAGVDENHGLGRLPLALVQAGSYIRSARMSFECYATMYQGKWKDLSDVLKAGGGVW